MCSNFLILMSTYENTKYVIASLFKINLGRNQSYICIPIPKYSKYWHYTEAHTIDCVCSKMLNHGLNRGLFLSLFKLILCPTRWIVYVLAYLNLNFKAVLALPKMAGSAQTHKSISFIWILWSTLYVYLWPTVCLKPAMAASNKMVPSTNFLSAAQ